MLPLLILVGGPPASGKTTLARLVGRRLDVPVISVEEIASGLALTTATQPRGAEVFTAFYGALEVLSTSGVTVVAEAAFTSRLAIDVCRFFDLAQVVFIRCQTPVENCRNRFAERAESRPGGAGAFDSQGLQLMDSGTFPWDEFVDFEIGIPTVRVDTTDGYDPPLEDIIKFVGA